MNRTRRIAHRVVPLLLVLAALVIAAVPCSGSPKQTRKGFQMIVDDDLTVDPGRSIGTVVIADGTLEFLGEADVIIALDADVRIAGHVGDVIAVNGQVDLAPGAVVDGNVQLVQALLLRDPGATIHGTIRDDSSLVFGAGLGTLGLLFGIGYSLALLVAAVLFAGIFPRVAHDAGMAMTKEVAKTALGTLTVWILVPIAAVLLMTTIVGIPFAVGLLMFLLPTVAFIGYLVAAVRLGDAILSRWRKGPAEDHPYAEALVGMLVLIVVSWIPGLGGVLTLLAFLGGSGALALMAWRAMRSTEAGEVGVGVAG
jgi:hypothetical protein